MIDSDIINGVHLYLMGIKPRKFKEMQTLLKQFDINLVEYLVITHDGYEYHTMQPPNYPLSFYNCFTDGYRWIYELDYFLSRCQGNEEYISETYKDQEFIVASVKMWYDVMEACIEKFGEFRIFPDYWRGDERNVVVRKIKFDEWTDVDFLRRKGEERILVVTRD